MPKILSKLFDKERYRKSWLKLFQSSGDLRGDNLLTKSTCKLVKDDRQPKKHRRSTEKNDNGSSWDSADDVSSLDSDEHKSDYDDENDNDNMIFENESSNKNKSKDRYKRRYSNSRRHRRCKSSLESFSDSNEDDGDDDVEFLTKEELYDLPAKVLRSKCQNVGLRTKNVIRKKDLVNLLFSYFQSNVDMSSATDSRSYHRPLHQQNEDEDDDEEMRTLLQEILPFYGQGDEASDQVVRETIEKLSLDALDLPDTFGNSILLLACQYAAYDLVPLLVRKGCDVNARNNDGSCCLHYACYTDTLSIEIVELLIRNGAQAEVVEKHYGCTPLHWAATSGDTYLCELIIEAGALLTTIDSNQYNPISYAKQAGNKECVRFLESQKQSSKTILSEDYIEETIHKSHENTAIELDRQTRMSSFDEMSHLSESSSSIERSTVRKDNESAHEMDIVKDLSNSFDEINSFDQSEKESNLVNEAKRSKERVKFIVSPGNKRIDESEFEASVHDSGYIVRPRSISKRSSYAPSKLPGSNVTNEHIPVSVTKETFEERLASLQSKMEEQLIQQLSLLEDKMSKSRRPPTPGLQRQHMNDSNTVAEMGARIINLQNEISTKDIEILTLKREIVALESKLASDVGPRGVTTPCNDIKMKLEAPKQLISSDDLKRLEDEVAVKEEKLRIAEEKNAELLANMNTLERQLASCEEKHARIEKQLKGSEDALSKERSAKDEVMSLLEQTRQGMEVDAQVTKSLEDARLSDTKEILRLQNDLKVLEEQSNADLSRLSDEFHEKEKLLLAEETRVSSMKGTLQRMKQKYEEDSGDLQLQHQKEMISLQDQLNQDQELVEKLRYELKEERLIKMQKELERNEAVQEMTSSNQRALDTERKLDEMKSMVEEAKGLFLNNEKLHRALHIETERRKKLHNKLEDMKGKIRIYVRIRPISSKELDRGSKEVLNKDDQRLCSMPPDDEKVNSMAKSWEFDQIFGGSSYDGNTQEAIFKDTRLLITSAIDGFNVCIFAYGQTGSGKTYTLGFGFVQGLQSDGSIATDAGLAPRAAAELFRVLKEKEASCDVEVIVNMFELYNDSLRDLLANPGNEHEKLKIKLAEHSDSGMVEVDGAVHEKVECMDDLLKLFDRGARNRTTSSTNMNADSSRSHLVTSIVTSVSNKRTGHTVTGKLTLVDLAGSERVGKSGATGTQLKEAQSINKSLSALGDVICALTSSNKGHIPYRNNPLTMLMSDSLGGTSKTLMFLCCSPADYNRSETCNSLDFAKRCKDVRNNIDSSRGDAAKVKALRVELARMKKQEMEGKTKSKSVPSGTGRRPGR